jgi:O-antigen/teichoic acid export membrane protein
VLTLMAGTTIAQAFPVAISPILTRIYTPEDFGLFAMYVAIVSIVAVIATGRYELAIMLPEKDEDAFQITILASVITLLMSSLLLLIVVTFNREIANILQNPEISPWLYLLPLSVLITGLYQALNYWHNRNKRYTSIAINRVVQSGGTVSGQLGLYFIMQSIGLIIGQLTGQFLGLLYFLKTYFLKDRRKYKALRSKAKVLAKQYQNFPKIEVPTALVNVCANQAPNILLASLFSANSAGFYYLTQRVLQVPITLISGSVLDVFKQRASEDYKKYGHCREIFKRTFWALLLIALPLSVVLFIVIQDLFTWVFGESWQEAGTYAQILILPLFLRFMANPLSFVFHIAGKQFWNLLTMLGLLFGVLFSLIISNDPSTAVTGIAGSYSIYYLVHFFLSARLARWL